MAKVKIIKVELPVLDENEELNEKKGEIEFSVEIEADELPSMPFYQYIQFGGEQGDYDFPHLVQFKTQAELDAYMLALDDALGWNSAILFDPKLSKDRKTIRFVNPSEFEP